MTDSVHVLTERERLKISEAFSTWPPSRATRFSELIYRSGMHPVVLAEPETWGLHTEGEFLLWIRPKNRKPIPLPMEPELKPWFSDWWDSYKARPVAREQIWSNIRDFGRQVGVRGLSPRGLRHTFLFRLAASGLPIDRVAFYGGCTITQAAGYIRMADPKWDQFISSGSLVK